MAHRKVAVITGITGQDGSYLAELLLEKDYIVHGIVRHSSDMHGSRIKHLLTPVLLGRRLHLHYGDLLDVTSIERIITLCMPDEFYNLAAMSDVKVSFDNPQYTTAANGTAVQNILEVIRQRRPGVKFYQASTSEMYGKVREVPQSETTPFHPRSPYGCAKVFAYWTVVNYREAYGMFASNGILFNHESPRRGTHFVTRKISRAVARIKLGLQEHITLGNLNAKRDWGYTKDYVHGMWMILQHKEADDFVLATGRSASVRDFAALAFKHAGIDILWKGSGIDEVGIDISTGKEVVKVSPDFFRPAEVEFLLGDCQKANTLLGWKSATSLDDLAEIMVKADLEDIQKKYQGPVDGINIRNFLDTTDLQEEIAQENLNTITLVDSISEQKVHPQ